MTSNSDILKGYNFLLFLSEAFNNSDGHLGTALNMSIINILSVNNTKVKLLLPPTNGPTGLQSSSTGAATGILPPLFSSTGAQSGTGTGTGSSSTAAQTQTGGFIIGGQSSTGNVVGGSQSSSTGVFVPTTPTPTPTPTPTIPPVIY